MHKTNMEKPEKIKKPGKVKFILVYAIIWGLLVGTINHILMVYFNNDTLQVDTILTPKLMVWIIVNSIAGIFLGMFVWRNRNREVNNI